MKFESRLLLYTAVGVSLIHIIAIGCSSFSYAPLSFTKPKERFVVKTISLNSKQATVPKTASKTASIIAPKVSQIASVVKKENAPKPIPVQKKAKPITPATTPPAKPQELSQKEKMLNKAKENVAKLRETRDNLVAVQASGSMELQDLGQIDSLRIDGLDAASGEEAGYYDLLAARLKQALRLPEMGSVKVLLTINKLGKVISVKIVSSESEYNRKFVESSLKKIQFPNFGKSFNGKNEYTFTITLANE